MAHVTSTGGSTAPVGTSPPATTSKAPAKSQGTTGGSPAAKAPAFKDDLAKATERLQPVPHHGRTKIIGGERDGRYINTSGNKRDGQTFTIEYHGGRRWHVYGEGADRVVIAFAKTAHKAADGGAAATPTPTGTTPTSTGTTPGATPTPTGTTPSTPGTTGKAPPAAVAPTTPAISGHGKSSTSPAPATGGAAPAAVRPRG